MEHRVKTQKLRIGGMTCVNCQNKIERKLNATAGVERAAVSYSAGTAEVTYDADVISAKEIAAVIEQLDYEVLTGERSNSKTRAAGILIIAVAAFVLLEQFGFTQLFSAFPLAEEGMGYGMLFVIGLVTSVHCVAMCGGINLSQCIPQAAAEDTGKLAALRPSFLYNLGRVVSYTAVGALVGALGSVVSFSGALKGAVQLLAGAFMVIMGLNMLGIFPWLRKLAPRMPRAFARGVNKKKAASNSPLYIGLLNGLMPCGPLQAMQLYALSTASPVKGALSMMLFSLGTVPLMFGLGALSSVLSKRFTRTVMTVGAALVVVLGLSMFTQGWSLSGLSLPELVPQSTQNPVQKAGETAQTGNTGITVENGVQLVTSTLSSGKYPAITVQAGTPVKWTINAPERSINGCNNRILIPEYDIEYQFQPGENVIEFTPEKTGKFPYSCWMGMIRGSITVVEAGAEVPAFEPAAQGGISAEPSEPVPAGVKIFTDAVAVAKIEDNLQTVEVELTDNGIEPAVVVMQANMDTEWTITNRSTRAGNAALLFPAYYTQFDMPEGGTPLYLYPTESFDFSTRDNAYYGYVKVVEDIENIDIGAIKEEAANYKTMIWPASYFEADGAVPGCCG
ncbi:MAG TPA: sulfite exporter TauE/SafE family protein [Feifaniaceae bacterium]|nr:sulfite exporter TauE/SafE family protein [Feifaniaceae bacterium]